MTEILMIGFWILMSINASLGNVSPEVANGAVITFCACCISRRVRIYGRL